MLYTNIPNIEAEYEQQIVRIWLQHSATPLTAEFQEYGINAHSVSQNFKLKIAKFVEKQNLSGITTGSVELSAVVYLCGNSASKCKTVRGAFTFIGSGMIIAGTAIILGGDSNILKTLPENLSSFQMMTEWVEPADVPPPQQTINSFN